MGLDPPPADQWRDWSDEIRNAPRRWSLAVAEEQRLIGRRVCGTRVTRENATGPLPLPQEEEEEEEEEDGRAAKEETATGHGKDAAAKL